MAKHRLSDRVEEHLGLRNADLPRGLVWIYVVGAVAGVPVFSRNFFELTPDLKLQSFVGNVLPFIFVPAAMHAVYHFVVPHLLERARSTVLRLLTHLLATTITAMVLGFLLHALISMLDWGHAPVSGFIATYIVMTWSILFPSKLVLAWRLRAEESERERGKAHETALRNELYAIQSRAHPHFLFNALNTVAALITEDPQRAEETLERFADVLRHVLETATAASTPLPRDMAVLREYLEIQRARFGESLHYSIEVEAGLEGVSAPPLLLLPLVENAVLHAVAQNGKGRIEVRVRQSGGRLMLDVEDDGPGTGRSSRHGTGTALRDLARRLAILYDGEASLVSRPRGGGGHAVGVSVPLSGCGGGDGDRVGARGS